MIITLRETTSTNDYAKKLAVHDVEPFTTVVAHRQTAGKGRLGRSFHSPEDEGIYMSIILYPHMAAELISSITLVAAMAVKNVLEEVVERKLHIKWPNDIVAEGKKVCGILTEASVGADGVKYVVVGIGVNVNNQSFEDELADKAISLRQISGDAYDTRGIVEMILATFRQLYDIYVETGNLGYMLDEYNDGLIHNGQSIRVINGEEVAVGKCLGMDETGALLLQEEGHSDITRVISGEVSVRGVYGYV